MIRTPLILSLSLRLLLLTCLAAGLQWFSPSISSASSLNATRFVHESGLVVLHAQRDSLPLVKAVLLIRSGTVHDPEGLSGLASITASLLTEGTLSMTAEEFSEEVEFIGATIGASASSDSTTYSLHVLKKDIDAGFKLYSDALMNPAFDSEELDRKREIIIGSLELQLENPNYISRRAFMNAVLGSHPYGKNSSGKPESLRAINREHLTEFHKTHFTPANAILAVAGDLTREELERLISTYLAKWTGPKPEKKPLEPTIAHGKSVVLNHMDISQANIYFGHLGVRRSHPDYYALQVMNFTLGGGGFSSRLMDRVRDDLGLAYSIRSTFAPFLHSGVFYVNVQTRNDAAETVIKEVKSIITDIKENGITKEELEASKAFLTGSFPRRLETIGRTAVFLALTDFHNLGLNYQEEYIKTINSLTLLDILDVASRHLRPENSVLSITADLEKAGLK
jgi:zinc protease